MRKFLFPLIALALLFVSCQSDVDILVAEPEFDAPVIRASISDETRTHLSIEGNIFKAFAIISPLQIFLLLLLLPYYK